MLRSKAEEAGAKYEEVPTRIVKPTRRCSGCGALKRHEDMPPPAHVRMRHLRLHARARPQRLSKHDALDVRAQWWGSGH